ncbi:Uncharacterized protein OBRU01_22140 [Operophtera brumata]|uniref:Uncharacterized protein n=1 Tax=Operophtera brumata TaxID=104452 RepID=A0A0L7KRE6_OPEBR|nr:Uncharacterized protein OBRU01_22140 [Operophtera brumata]
MPRVPGPGHGYQASTSQQGGADHQYTAFILLVTLVHLLSLARGQRMQRVPGPSHGYQASTSQQAAPITNIPTAFIFLVTLVTSALTRSWTKNAARTRARSRLSSIDQSARRRR